MTGGDSQMSAFKATIKDTRYLEENTDEKASYGPIAAHRDDSKECNMRRARSKACQDTHGCKKCHAQLNDIQLKCQ